jgi:hypothetical protein
MFQRRNTNSNSGLSTWWYVIGIVVLIGLVAGFIKYGEKIRSLYKKKDKNSGKVPDWVSAEKAHSKK